MLTKFSERATKRKLPSKLDPYLPYLREQLATGRAKFDLLRQRVLAS